MRSEGFLNLKSTSALKLGAGGCWNFQYASLCVYKKSSKRRLSAVHAHFEQFESRSNDSPDSQEYDFRLLPHDISGRPLYGIAYFT